MRKSPGILWSFLLIAGPLVAQQTDEQLESTVRIVDYEAVRSTKHVRAVRTTQPIEVDGFLDEPAWATAGVASDFYQSDPVTGAPASEKTEIRILFGDDFVYVGVVAHQAGPVIVSELSRDFQPTDGDHISLVFDTFNDGRDAFGFAVNPGGAQRDQQIMGGVRSIDWDGIWQSAVQIQPPGWTVEFAIPFSTLRFDRTQPVHTWGFNVLRITRHKNEWALWSPGPKPFGVLDLSIAGVVAGVEPRQTGWGVHVMPFGVAMYRPDLGSDAAARRNGEIGLDVKWGITPSLTLDATLNTDFSQVEVDEQQVNLTRFSLFFPEKRPFFLENFGLFDVGGSAGGIGLGSGGFRTARPIIPFFSRRIGLSAAGEPLPIQGGVRLTGKLAGLGLGLLNMQVDSHGAAPADNWTVVRLKRDVLSRSGVGTFLFNRIANRPADWNRVAGMDGVFRLLSQRLVLSGIAMASQTPGNDEDNAAVYLESAYGDQFYAAKVSFVSTGEGFRNDFGFIPRPGVRQWAGFAGVRPRPRSGPIRELFPQLQLDYVTDHAGRPLSRSQRAGLNLAFHDGATLTVNREFNFERLNESFRIRPGITIPSGDYNFADWGLGFSTSRARLLSANGQLATGKFWSGSRRELRLGGAYRPSIHFSGVASWSRNWVDLREGSFESDLFQLRLDTAFSPKMFLDALFQYNSDMRTVQSQVRYRLIHRPLSDLYLVYGEVRGVQDNQELERTISAKFTYLINF